MMFEVKSITFHPCLDKVCFSLKPGEYLWVSGLNGAGKSTLLKIIVGLIQPHAGDIHWHGRPFQSHREGCIYIGHQNALSRALTLLENIQLDWYYTNDTTWRIGLNILQLNACLHQPLACLSQGQQRKAALLRLWMKEVPLWILDEPFDALDEASSTLLEKHLQQHLLKGGIMILASHYPVTFLSQQQIRLQL